MDYDAEKDVALLKLEKATDLREPLLLCSDGVSGVLTPPELVEAMALRPEEGCALLEQMVLEKDLPAQDNFTGILISCK